jgi:hypothetical protein
MDRILISHRPAFENPDSTTISGHKPLGSLFVQTRIHANLNQNDQNNLSPVTWNITLHKDKNNRKSKYIFDYLNIFFAVLIN